MRLPRLTTRRLMALVVVVAILFALATPWLTLDHKALVERRSNFMLQWFDHSRAETSCTGEKSAYHAAMARKYLFAAKHPRLPVLPDPPPPK
jgi:hypothetical protein